MKNIEMNFDEKLLATIIGENGINIYKTAPELLGALEGMLDWARRVKTINPGMEIFNAMHAIAKAKG